MKKTIVFFLIVVITITFTIGSYADSDSRIELAESMQDYAAEKLEQLLVMYKNDQSNFSKEYLYLTYSYYDMWIAMKKVANAEDALQFSDSTLPVWNMLIESEKQIHNFNKTSLSNYDSWLKGDLSDDDFCMYLMIQVEAVIEMNNARK